MSEQIVVAKKRQPKRREWQNWERIADRCDMADRRRKLDGQAGWLHMNPPGPNRQMRRAQIKAVK